MTSGESRRDRPAVHALLFAPIPALFYLGTTAPGLAHADQAILINAMSRAELHSGATSHNLTVLVGYAFIHGLPFGDVAYRANLVSTTFATAAVALFFALARRVTGGLLPAVSAALFLMVSHSMWWHATVAEVYAANALLCTAILWCLVLFDTTAQRRWLDAAAFLCGFALFNHAQMGMWVPALAAVHLVAGGRFRGGAGVVRSAVFYAAGALPYVLVFARDALRGGGLERGLQEAAGGEFTSLFFSVNASGLRDTARIFIMQWGWPTPYLVYAAAGLVWAVVRGAHPAATAAALAAFLVNTVFFAFYPTWDKYAFLLSSFVVLSFFGTLGLGRLWRWLAARGRAAALGLFAVNTAACAYAVTFYVRLPDTATHSRFWRPFLARPETRCTMFDGRYLANPDKGAYLATENYVRRTFDRLPSEAILVDHISRTFFQFAHVQAFRGQRRDVELVAFVPPGTDPARWPNGVDRDGAVSRIVAELPRRDLFMTSLVLPGLAEVISALLDRGVTFLEVPLGPHDSVFQARWAVQIPLAPWVEEVRAAPTAGTLGLEVHFKRRNPPFAARVDWVGADGSRRAGPPVKVVYDTPPLRFEPPPGLPKGLWTAELVLFEQGVASLDLRH